MAPFDYLPGSVSTSTFTKRRDLGGVYDCLVDSFTSMGSSAIANADVDKTFFRYVPNEHQPDCQYYRDSESAEYSGNVFGEILGQAHGTFVGARGNHYPGPNASKPNQITDQTKTRCSIVIGCPSFAPDRLKNLWHNQLCTFVGLRDSELDSNNVNTKEIVKSITPGHSVDAITLTGGLMYTTSKRSSTVNIRDNQEPTSVTTRSYKKRPLSVEDGSSTGMDSDAVNNRHKAVVWPSENDIHLGAEYDHRLMPDFGGRLFALKRAKLLQPDWRDINGGLIVPWSNHTSLRPGTVVVANVSIRAFTVRSRGMHRPERKVYQALINHLQVVAESDIHVAVPVPLSVNTVEGRSTVVLGHDSGAAAFDALKAVFVSRSGSATESSSFVASDSIPHGKNKKPRSEV
ncbi:hypothetical protein F5879DRAFT_988130 [Lentinula edodes]|nr:hypothetical protein F5879DRAFT_988130 [Lentinula edodes]